MKQYITIGILVASTVGCASLRRPQAACNAIGRATDAITMAYLETVAWPETPESVSKAVEKATQEAADAHDMCFEGGAE